MEMLLGEPAVRVATPNDVSRIQALDDLCFPSDDLDRERAVPGEIEAGVEQGRVTVVELDGVVVGFLQVDHLSDHHIYIEALGVDPATQGRGIGRVLADHFLASVIPNTASVSTVTSPRNVRMLRLLFDRGFVVRRVMRDYFGEGKDRFYCQLRMKHRFVDPDDRYLVPTHSLNQVYRLLDSEEYVLTDVLQSSSTNSMMFEVSKFDVDDLAGLQASESSSGLAFATAVLAALTFLLAFAFASPRYPAGAQVLLMLATLISTGSLIIYANASGELARLRSNTFVSYMKWGNLLSEYGGVIPFLLALPITFRAVAESYVAAVVVAVLFSIALLAYEFSSFSMLARYPRRALFILPAVASSALPIFAVTLPEGSISSWVWTATSILVLTLRVGIALPKSLVERRRDGLGAEALPVRH